MDYLLIEVVYLKLYHLLFKRIIDNQFKKLKLELCKFEAYNRVKCTRLTIIGPDDKARGVHPKS